MAQVKEDLERGHVLTRSGWRRSIRRTFRVSELLEAPQYQLMEALDVLITGPYDAGDGDLYPFSPTPEYPDYTSCRVINQDASPDGPNAAVIVVTYSNDRGSVSSSRFDSDGSQTRQVDFGTKVVETQTDRDDVDMLLNPPPSRASAGAAWEPYKSTARLVKPLGRIVFEVRYDTDPEIFAYDELVGKISDGVLGKYAAGTVMFAQYSSDGDDVNGWPTTFSFEIDPDGWTHRDVYKSPQDKLIPADAVEQEFDVIAEANFGVFGFSWPT